MDQFLIRYESNFEALFTLATQLIDGYSYELLKKVYIYMLSLNIIVVFPKSPLKILQKLSADVWRN